MRAHHFQSQWRLMAGSTQSKQWQIELFCRYKRAKTSRITVLNIQKLYLYFVYFKLYVYFEWSPTVSLKHDARTTWKVVWSWLDGILVVEFEFTVS